MAKLDSILKEMSKRKHGKDLFNFGFKKETTRKSIK